MNEFVLSTDILTEYELTDPKEYKVRAIVLLVESEKFNSGYNQNLLGKQMKNWVRGAVSHFDCEFVTLPEGENPLNIIKPYVKDEDYTIVLFSDTPLLKSSVVLDTLDYATTKKLDFCKMPRGFIVDSKSLINNNFSLTAEPNFYDKEDFYTVFDYTTLAKAKDVIRLRILNKHLKNKVIIENINTNIIDCDVEIAPQVFIGNNNVILGDTKIKENTKILYNCVIENSLIEENCTINCSCVKDAIVKENTNINAFNTVTGEN